jgi:hypothetical protein
VKFGIFLRVKKNQTISLPKSVTPEENRTLVRQTGVVMQ